ncbi:hypothetical protein P3T22_003617 [Paraburkholderia sp. GAS348]
MKQRNWLKRIAIYVATAVSTGLLLAACATPGTKPADGCVGPPTYCVPYFGS